MNKQACLLFIFLCPALTFACNLSTPRPTHREAATAVAVGVEELAVRLSGEAAKDCGVQGVGLKDFPLEVDTCTIAAIEAKTPFRVLRVHSRTDTIDYYWIVGTPEGEVYVILYTDSAMSQSVSEPNQQLCENPKVVTLDGKHVLECQ